MIVARGRKRDNRKVYDVRLRDPSGHMYTRTFASRREAKAFEAAEQSARARGAWVDPRRADTPFSEAATAWLDASAHKRPLSVARDYSIVANHLLPVLGIRPLSSVAPAEIQRLVNTWAAIAAANTVVRQYATLRAIFTHAVNTDMLLRSPCRAIRLPRTTSRESPILTTSDLAALAAVMPGLEPMPYLGGVLGLRWAEIAGLRVASLDFRESTVTIDRQWTRGPGGIMVSQDPKSRAGRRTLSAPSWLMAMLSDHMEARGLRGVDLDAVLFVGPDGNPLHYSNWRQRVWLPAIAAGGLAGLRFHDLRHTAGTALVAGGVDVKTAQVRLGHASPLTTLRVYAQATSQADRDAAGRLDDLFRPADSSVGADDDRAGASGGRDLRTHLSADGHGSVPRDGCAIVSLRNEGGDPEGSPDQDISSGARWNRTTDLSIISAAL